MKRFLKAALNGEDLSDSEETPPPRPINNFRKKSLKAAFLYDDDSDDDAINQSSAVVLPSRGKDVDSNNIVKSLNSFQTRSTSPAISTNNSQAKREAFFGSPALDYGNYYRPAFEKDFMRSDEPILLSYSNEDAKPIQVNRYTARYLIDHQVIGVKWLFSKYQDSEGAILGDDMGMGKTVQIAALLSAIFEKTGTEDDKERNKRKKRSQILSSDSDLPSPVLVICPKSIVDNWSLELNRWGYFLLDNLTSAKDESIAEDIITRAATNRTEIVLVSYSMISKFHEQLSTIHWSMLILDEGHTLKNENNHLYGYISSIKKAKCRILLTGTPIQNDLRELWALLNMIYNGKLMNKIDFINRIEKPIKLGMSSASDKTAEMHAAVARNALMKILDNCLLGRKKDTLTGDNKLKGKEEIIVFCELTELQQRMYQECLANPVFDNVRYCSARTTEYDGDLPIQYQIPYDCELLETTGREELDRRAVLWQHQHSNDEPCEKCPTCMQLPCLSRLSKIANHPVLLQSDRPSQSQEKQRKAEEFLHAVFSPQTIAELGGVQRSTQFMIRQSTATSGKMKTLMEMLRFFVSYGEKSLIFSISTQVLDLLQAMIIAQGWRHLRLDGQTPTKQRQKLVDEFNTIAHGMPMIFLISSRAGGLGLNLNTATKVIIFDVDWNPTVDMQSQDRAYRIGQKESVCVYRLVAQGTVEELAYMRQLYKQQLQHAVLPWERQKLLASTNPTKSKKRFEKGQFQGVEGEITMRGELFGIQNLFQFSTHSILTALRNRFANRAAATSSLSSSSSSAAATSVVKKRQLPLTFADQRTEGQDDRLLPTEDLGELIMQLAIDPDVTPASSDNKEGENDAMALLQNIGFNLRNAHKNDDMLKHRNNAASSSSSGRQASQQSMGDDDDDIMMDVDEEKQRLLLEKIEKQKQEKAKQQRLLKQASGRPPISRKRPADGDNANSSARRKVVVLEPAHLPPAEQQATAAVAAVKRPLNRLQSMEEKDTEGDVGPPPPAAATVQRIPAHEVETQFLPDDFDLAPAPPAGGGRRQLPATLASGNASSKGYYKPSYA